MLINFYQFFTQQPFLSLKLPIKIITKSIKAPNPKKPRVKSHIIPVPIFLCPRLHKSKLSLSSTSFHIFIIFLLKSIPSSDYQLTPPPAWNQPPEIFITNPDIMYQIQCHLFAIEPLSLRKLHTLPQSGSYNLCLPF